MESVPHIYLSCLPFLPIKSIIPPNPEEFPNIVEVKQGRRSTWDTHVLTLNGHSTGVSCVSYSSQASLIVSGSYDGEIRLWDPRTGESRVLKNHTGPVNSLCFTPDGKHLISSSWYTVIIWDLRTDLPMCDPLTGHSDWVRTVAITPNGDLFASGSDDKTIRLWSTKTGDQKGPAWKSEHSIYSIAFSPNGAQLASADIYVVKIWDVASSEVLKRISTGLSDPYLVAFSPDGSFLVVGDGSEIHRINSTTGVVMENQTIRPNSYITSMSFPNSKNPAGIFELVSCSNDGSIRFWNANTGVESGPRLYSNGVNCIVYSPNEETVISGSNDHAVRIWSRSLVGEVSQPLERHEDRVNAVAYSPSGEYIATGGVDLSVRIWNVVEGKLFAKLPIIHTDNIQSISYSPDGMQLATSSSDRTIQLWDLKKLEPIGPPWIGHTGSIRSIAFSPDGTKLISGSYDETVGLWDLNQSPPSFTPLKAHNDRVNSVAFSPDGTTFASCSDDETVVIWRTETGTVVGEPIQVAGGWLMSMTYSPDGTKIAIGSRRDLTIWDVETRSMVEHSPLKHDDWVQSVAFSRCGNFVVSGCKDGAIRVWDLKHGVMVGKPLLGHTDDIRGIAISPNGRQIASVAWDKSVRLWDMRLDKASDVQSPKDVVLYEDEIQYPTSLFGSYRFNLKQDGWIRGSSGELLLWIPHEHRVGLRGPGVRELGAPITELSFEHFKCGTEWMECRQ